MPGAALSTPVLSIWTTREPNEDYFTDKEIESQTDRVAECRLSPRVSDLRAHAHSHQAGQGCCLLLVAERNCYKGRVVSALRG